MFVRILTLTVFALFLSACGKEGGNGAPPAVEDGLCTQAFIDEYNALTANVKTTSSSAQIKLTTLRFLPTEEAKIARVKEARADYEGIKTRVTDFKNRFPGVVCDAKDRTTGLRTTVRLDTEVDNVVAKSNEQIKVIDDALKAAM